MKIVQVKIEELIPADYNPREASDEDVKHLTESIKRFGLIDPILVNENPKRKNIIIGGHFRVRIAKELGFKEVPVIYLDLTEEKERELNLRLNRNTGDFDYDLLANNFDSDMLLSIGFTPEELGVDQGNKDKTEHIIACPHCSKKIGVSNRVKSVVKIDE